MPVVTLWCGVIAPPDTFARRVQVLDQCRVITIGIRGHHRSRISLLYVMEDGASAEIAIVGNEGILGTSLFMGGDSTPSRAVVQSAGQACRLKAGLLEDLKPSCQGDVLWKPH